MLFILSSNSEFRVIGDYGFTFGDKRSTVIVLSDPVLQFVSHCWVQTSTSRLGCREIGPSVLASITGLLVNNVALLCRTTDLLIVV